MDAKRKAALIKELSAGKGLAKPAFDGNYTRENRVWFVTAIVNAILDGTPTPADSAVPKLAREVINDANFAVALERDFTPILVLDEKLAKIVRKDIVRRVEIIYGIVAQNMALADTTHDTFNGLTPMRQFLTNRRYRAVLRMIYQVNPNDNGFMRYPDECKQSPPPGNVRLNVDARPFWTAAGPTLGSALKVSGQNDPATAVAKIWERPFPKKEEACSGNLLDCANAACCMLLDSLGEADDRDKFYKAIQSRGPTHFLIINPNFASEEHCLWDKPDEPERIFDKVLVEEKDFQVGDHVVVENHGLYASVMPGGFWVAEHSLVTNVGNRKTDNGRGILFGGHGLDDPFHISALYDDLIKTIQTRLHRTFKMADLYMRFRKNPTTIPASNVQTRFGEQVVDPRSGQTVKVDAFKITHVVSYDNYNKAPARGRRSRRSEGEEGNPIVFLDFPDLNQIAISPTTLKNTIDDQLSRFERTAHSMTFLQRDPPSGGGHTYDRQFWKIVFNNSMTGKDDLFPVFGGKDGTFQLLERKEMPKGEGRYFRGNREADEHGALITRPTTDSSDTYLSFLASVGAIVRWTP